MALGDNFGSLAQIYAHPQSAPPIQSMLAGMQQGQTFAQNNEMMGMRRQQLFNDMQQQKLDYGLKLHEIDQQDKKDMLAFAKAGIDPTGMIDGTNKKRAMVGLPPLDFKPFQGAFETFKSDQGRLNSLRDSTTLENLKQAGYDTSFNTAPRNVQVPMPPTVLPFGVSPDGGMPEPIIPNPSLQHQIKPDIQVLPSGRLIAVTRTPPKPNLINTPFGLYDETAGNYIPPPAGFNEAGMKGELGSLASAYSAIGDKDPMRAAAEDYISTKGGGMFSIAKRMLKESKSPEEARQALADKYPLLYKSLQDTAEGRIPISGWGKDQNELRQLISSLFPNFDWTKFNARQKLQMDLADVNSSYRKNITSLNTLSSHLAEFDKKIEALKASNSPPENAFALFIRDVLEGDPSVTGADITKEAVFNELERALSGVGATQQGIERISSSVRRRGIGYQQLKETVNSLAHLMDQRLNNMEQEYQGITGEKAPSGLYRYPDAQKSLDAILNRSGGGENKVGRFTIVGVRD